MRLLIPNRNVGIGRDIACRAGHASPHRNVDRRRAPALHIAAQVYGIAGEGRRANA
jgi:hypothetical protein